MHNSPKVLVVGTTPDYIDWIRRIDPGRALFLTDAILRRQAVEPRPAPGEELCCNPADYKTTAQTLKQHLWKKGLRLDGIACFDCESMELAALLAKDFNLPYPSAESVRHCRNKYVSKKIWQRHGVMAPRASLVHSPEEAAAFLQEVDGPCVLKPLSGSGSELVFNCAAPLECEKAFRTIRNGTQERRASGLYRMPLSEEHPVIAEELVEGIEFSCDFLIENRHVEIIRLTRKIHAPGEPFGTIRGYVLTDALPVGIDEGDFRQILYQSATTLGISRAICMLDFLVRGDDVVLLEIAPRPGGDCLPSLLRKSGNLDILKLTLDFAQQRPVDSPQVQCGKPWIGLRLHAPSSGILKKIDAGPLHNDPRVCEVHLTKKPGDAIRMPPEDYDSWLLGHVIVQPFTETAPETQCDDIAKKLKVEMA